MAYGVDSLPSDDHCHHRRLARAGGQLERESRQLGIGFAIDGAQVIEKALAVFPDFRRDLREPDDRFDRFDLTEKRTHSRKVVSAPVLQQAAGFRSDAPLIGVLEIAPPVDLCAQFVDQRADVVLLFCRRKPFPFVEHKRRLRL